MTSEPLRSTSCLLPGPADADPAADELDPDALVEDRWSARRARGSRCRCSRRCRSPRRGWRRCARRSARVPAGTAPEAERATSARHRVAIARVERRAARSAPRRGAAGVQERRRHRRVVGLRREAAEQRRERRRDLARIDLGRRAGQVDDLRRRAQRATGPAGEEVDPAAQRRAVGGGQEGRRPVLHRREGRLDRPARQGELLRGVRGAGAGLGARVDDAGCPLGTTASAGAAASRAIAASPATRRPCTGPPSHAAPTGGKAAVGSAPVRRGKAIGWTLVLGLVAWALVGRGLVNYDTLYALVWGRDLTHGTLPDYDVSLAPTPHPLATLAGAVLSVLGASAAPSTRRSSSPSSSSARWAGSPTAWARRGSTARPARWRRRSCSRAGRCSTSARAPTSTSPTSRSCSERCSSRPGERRAGAPVLALLGVAGLIRPEAWLFSAAYLVWLWVGGVRDPRLWALAAAAPLLWALGDLIVTGDPLHSLTGTRDTAQRLQRITGLTRSRGPSRGAWARSCASPCSSAPPEAGCWRSPSCARAWPLGAAAGVIALVAFCVLAAAGLPILGRYLLAPATILALFCGAGAFGWAELPREHPWRRRWAWFGALTLVGLVAFIPAQVNRIGDLRDALRIQDAHPGRPARAHAALALHAGHGAQPPPGAAAGAVARRRAPSASPSPRSAGRAAAPTSCRRARASRASTSSTRATSTRASRRRPPGFLPVGANASWRAFARCG